MEHGGIFLPLCFTYQSLSSRQLGSTTSITATIRETHCRDTFHLQFSQTVTSTEQNVAVKCYILDDTRSEMKPYAEEREDEIQGTSLLPAKLRVKIYREFPFVTQIHHEFVREKARATENALLETNRFARRIHTSRFCYLGRVLYSRKRAAGANIHSCLRCSGRHPVAPQARLLTEVARDLCSYYFHRNAPAALSSKHEHTS